MALKDAMTFLQTPAICFLCIGPLLNQSVDGFRHQHHQHRHCYDSTVTTHDAYIVWSGTFQNSPIVIVKCGKINKEE